MSRKPAPAAKPFADWASLGLPAFAAALMPWHEKLFAASLISGLYQPRLNIIASVTGALVCFASWWILHQAPRPKLVRACKISVAAFFAAIAFCLFLLTTLDTSFFPPDQWVPPLLLAWQGIYLLIFASFAIAASSGMLLARF